MCRTLRAMQTSVRIIHGERAPELEVFAAGEALRYLQRLYRMSVAVGEGADSLSGEPSNGESSDGEPSDGESTRILIGNPETNPLVKSTVGRRWPELTDQGFAILQLGTPASGLVVGGGSPRATLWGVYELFERWYGVRYLHWTDVYPGHTPAEAADFHLPEADVVCEPAVRQRTWSGWNDFSLEYWGLEDHRRYIDQLAKLKVNGYSIGFLPYHPAAKLEFRGVRQSRGTLNWGLEFPIEDDVVGREAFCGAHRFTNPDFAGCQTFDEMHEAFRSLMTAIIRHAHGRGLDVSLGFSVTDFPHEFKEHFSEWSNLPSDAAVPVKNANFGHLGTEYFGTDPTDVSYQNVDDPVLWELSKAIIKTYIETYPEADSWNVWSSEFTAPVTDVRKKWDSLDAKYRLSEVRSYDEVLEQARCMEFYGEGRAEREVKAAIEFLYLLDKIFMEGHVLEEANRVDAKFHAHGLGFMHKPFCDVAAKALAGIFPHHRTTVVPPGGYTMGETLRQIDTWSPPGGADVDVRLPYRNENDMVLLLPQVRVAGAETVMNRVRSLGTIAAGSTGTRLVRCQDLTGGYIARLFWDDRLEARRYLADHLGAICGSAAVPEAEALFEVLESVTDYLDDPNTWLGFPVSGLMSGQFEAGKEGRGSKPEYERLRVRYVEALEHVRRAYAESRPAGREYLGYFSDSLEFAVRFIGSAQMTREAGCRYSRAQSAREDRRPREAEEGYANCLRLLGEAVEQMREALRYRVKMAFDQSERELLIAANNFGYKYLKSIRWLVSLESMSWGIAAAPPSG